MGKKKSFSVNESKLGSNYGDVGNQKREARKRKHWWGREWTDDLESWSLRGRAGAGKGTNKKGSREGEGAKMRKEGGRKGSGQPTPERS